MVSLSERMLLLVVALVLWRPSCATPAIDKLSTSVHEAWVLQHTVTSSKQPPTLPQWAQDFQKDLTSVLSKHEAAKTNGSKVKQESPAPKKAASVTKEVSNVTTKLTGKEGSLEVLAHASNASKYKSHSNKSVAMTSAKLELKHSNTTVVKTAGSAPMAHATAQTASVTKTKKPAVTTPAMGAPVTPPTKKAGVPAKPSAAKVAEKPAVQQAAAVHLAAQPTATQGETTGVEETSKEASSPKANHEEAKEMPPESEATSTKDGAATKDFKEGFKAGQAAVPCATKAPKKLKAVPAPAKKFEVPYKSAHRFMTRDSCQCEFQNTCSCVAAMEFMDCVAHACASGMCDCSEVQYEDACRDMAGTCRSLDFDCSKDKAVCLSELESDLESEKPEVKKTPEEVLEELRDLKEKKCRLQEAADDGWLNAKTQLEDTNAEIQDRLADLVHRGDRLPEMHCEKHFEEWHMLEHLKEDTQELKSSATRRFMAAIFVVCALLCIV